MDHQTDYELNDAIVENAELQHEFNERRRKYPIDTGYQHGLFNRADLSQCLDFDSLQLMQARNVDAHRVQFIYQDEEAGHPMYFLKTGDGRFLSVSEQNTLLLSEAELSKVFSFINMKTFYLIKHDGKYLNRELKFVENSEPENELGLLWRVM